MREIHAKTGHARRSGKAATAMTHSAHSSHADRDPGPTRKVSKRRNSNKKCRRKAKNHFFEHFGPPIRTLCHAKHPKNPKRPTEEHLDLPLVQQTVTHLHDNTPVTWPTQPHLHKSREGSTREVGSIRTRITTHAMT